MTNVALTGAYGTGKSSILAHVREAYASRVLELSLSTIAPEAHDETDAPRPLTRTNQIQKELVKQLLYRLPANSMPQSRFRRASVPDKKRDWKLATAGGSAAFVLLFGLGLIQPAVEALLPVVWRQVIAYVLLFAAAIGLFWVVLTVLRGRPVVSASVQTGPATITLSKESATYFDEYLDEIVYFFQVSKRDVVLIEDIDRFEDAQVFDTLRALNVLLNESTQIGRPIVFVYAVRDSVFEEIGVATDDLDADVDIDRAKASLKRASRTKFFDLIIPVVPFVSPDNARDLMSEAMKSAEFEIDPALIRLAARHVADMRLIQNIRNEFDVYRDRLILSTSRIPGITEDLVFAVILYKNTHLADFEKIRHRESALDTLYGAWRILVRENTALHRRELAQRRSERDRERTMQGAAEGLGRRLEAFTELLRTAAQSADPQTTVTVVAPTSAGEDASNTEAWEEIVASDSLSIVVNSPVNRYRQTFELKFTVNELSKAMGVAIDRDTWQSPVTTNADRLITESEASLQFLRHHDWRALAGRDDFTATAKSLGVSDSRANAADNEEMSFNEIIDAVLESKLARDLVRHGFLTPHFALYTSVYYGSHLGPDAMEYIRRCIEPGEPDMGYEIPENEVEQILREQGAEHDDGAELFSDPSVFNVSIVDYLLKNRPLAAQTVARRLTAFGAQESEFITLYDAQGAHPGSFLAALAPNWSHVLLQAAHTQTTVESAAEVMDAVLSRITRQNYETDQTVVDLLESQYESMTSIMEPRSDERAKAVMSAIKRSGALLRDIEQMNDIARREATARRVFPVTENNLRALIPTQTIALDTMRTNTDLYAFIIDNLGEYLELVRSGKAVVTTSAEAFAKIVEDVASGEHLWRLTDIIDLTDESCRVTDLTDVSKRAWPFLVGSLRTEPSFANVARYVSELTLDASIAKLLIRHKAVTGAIDADEGSRASLAFEVLSANEHIPSTLTRVRIVGTMRIPILAPAQVPVRSGDLVARLLKARLLPDDEATFSERLMVDWQTLRATILVSKNFASFVSVNTLPVHNVHLLIRDQKIKLAVRQAVVNDLPDFLALASARQAIDITRALNDTGWRLSYQWLESLRAAGAVPTQLIALMAKRADDLSTTDIKRLLTSFGGDYARVAAGGRGQPKFPIGPSHEYILRRLVGSTITRVEQRSFKHLGERLVVTLRS